MTTTQREALVAAAGLLVVLTAIAAYQRVFVDPTWVRPTVLAAVAATALAVVLHRLGVGVLAALLVQLAVLGVVVDLLWLGDGGLLPSWEDLAALRELLAAAGDEVEREQAPTLATPGLVAAVQVGTWLVAHVVHELAVRGERPGGALVPAAVLWTVPLAMPQPPGRTWTTALPFLLAGGLLLLLGADADLRGWARQRLGPRVGPTGIGVGAAAVVVGLVLPGVLPGYGGESWLEVSTGRDPKGYQPIVDIGDRLDLPGDRPVLQVESDRPTYLRLAALDTFDGTTWRVGPADGGTFSPDSSELFPADEPLPPDAGGQGPSEEIVVDVEVLDLENIYVPVPQRPVEVRGAAARDMVYSQVGGFVATGELAENEIGGLLRTGVRRGLEYSVLAAVPTPDAEALRRSEPAPGEVGQWTTLPPGARYDQLGEVAQQVYGDAGAGTTLDRALALQRWFTTTGGFTYSVEDVDPLRGGNALETFVNDTRTGYCEYFATAMAVMLRATGIPARVAVGFLPGEPIGERTMQDGSVRTTRQVGTSDAHAWVEVLFPGQGWIKFDPTPRTDGATLVPTGQELDPLRNEAERASEAEGPDPGLDAPGTDVPVPDGPVLPQDAAEAGGDTGTGTDDGPPRWPLAVVALVLLAGAGLVLRDRRAADEQLDARTQVLAAQRRVLDTGAGLGLPRPASATVPEVLHLWAADGRVAPEPAARLAAAGQRAAFAPRDTSHAAAAAREDADALVAQLRAAATRGERVLAPVRPGAERLLGPVAATTRRLRGRG